MVQITPRRSLALATVAAAALGAGAAPALAAHQPDRIQRATDRVLRSGAPGVVVSVRDGARTTHHTAGVADPRSHRRPATDARVRIGSVSKTFLATTVLQLVREGRLSLDDRLGTLLPGLLPRLDEDAITVRMLMDHTAGVPDPTQAIIEHPGQLGSGAVAPARLVAAARGMAPTHAPGARFSYSNTDYQLLGMIVEQVTGRPYTEALQQRVIGPLRLRATRTPTARTTLPAPMLHGITRYGGHERDATRFNPTWAGPAGGIVSTTDDLARFGQALLGGRLLDRASLTLMQGDAREAAAHYGLGLQRRRTPCGRVVFGHEGGMLGYATRLEVTADGRTAVAAGVSTDETPKVDRALDRVVDAAVCR